MGISKGNTFYEKEKENGNSNKKLKNKVQRRS